MYVVLSQRSIPTAKAVAKLGLLPLAYLQTLHTPSMTFARKLSLLLNLLKQLLRRGYAAGPYALLMILSNLLTKPILLVQNYSGCSIKLKNPPFKGGYVAV